MPLPRAPWFAAALVAGLLAAAAAVPAGAATLDLAGLPGTAVAVNGRAVGFLPLDAPLDLAPGRYEITASLVGYQDFATTVSLEAEGDAATVLVRLQRLSRATAWRSSVLFAGLGQFYVGHRTRGWLYAAAEAGGLATAVAGELMRSDARKEHLALLEDYDRAINADEAVRLREAAAAKYADMEDAESLRDTGLLVAAGAVVLSVADALLTFPEVAAGPGPVIQQSRLSGDGAAPAASLSAFHAGVRLTF